MTKEQEQQLFNLMKDVAMYVKDDDILMMHSTYSAYIKSKSRSEHCRVVLLFMARSKSVADIRSAVYRLIESCFHQVENPFYTAALGVLRPFHTRLMEIEALGSSLEEY